jgi:hypothetical protein
MPDALEDLALGGLLSAALEISAGRRDTLSRLRAAIMSGRDDEALLLARLLCGVEDEQKGDRADQGVD